jgi:hypothetical protein
MKNFKNHYGDLRKKRSEIGNTGLGKIYKDVLSQFKKSFDDGNYLVSFLIIQSLLEDRIYVFYRIMLIHRNQSEGNDEIPELNTILRSKDVKDVIKELKSYGWVDDVLRDKLFNTLDIRNKHIHFSFMGIENFSEDLCKGFYNQFREIDKLIKKYKRELGK